MAYLRRGKHIFMCMGAIRASVALWMHFVCAHSLPSRLRVGPLPLWCWVLGPWSVVLGRIPRPVQAAAMADRDMSWSILEKLYPGSPVRDPVVQIYTITIARICGLSDRLTGPRESTCVLHRLRAALLRLPFCSTCCIIHRLSPRQSKQPSRAIAKDVQHR